MLAACRRVAWCGEGESINVLFPSLEIPLSDAIFEMSPMMAKIFSFQDKYFLSKNKVFKNLKANILNLIPDLSRLPTAIFTKIRHSKMHRGKIIVVREGKYLVPQFITIKCQSAVLQHCSFQFLSLINSIQFN